MRRLALSLAFSALAAAPLAAQAPERHTLSGREVELYTLVGDVTVKAGSGSDVEVVTTRRGDDAGRLRIETGPIGGRESLRVIFPSGDILVPREYDDDGNNNSNVTMRVRDDGTFFDSDDSDRGGRRIRISTRDGDVEAGADLAVSVPRGARVFIRVGIGAVTVTNVNGEIDVRGVASPVDVEGLTGSLRARTTSGEVKVVRSEASLEVGSTSGGLTIQGVRGDVRLSSTSGDLDIDDVTGASVMATLTSGSVDLTNVTADRIQLRLTSGRVRAQNTRTADLTAVSTSGDVDVTVDATLRNARVGSTSGDVTIRIPESLGADIEATTTSGEIETEMPIRVTERRAHHIIGQIGDGGARIRASSTSGNVRVARAGRR